jgi:hypothetical protein
MRNRIGSETRIGWSGGRQRRRGGGCERTAEREDPPPPTGGCQRGSVDRRGSMVSEQRGSDVERQAGVDVGGSEQPPRSHGCSSPAPSSTNSATCSPAGTPATARTGRPQRSGRLVVRTVGQEVRRQRRHRRSFPGRFVHHSQAEKLSALLSIFWRFANNFAILPL